VTVRPIAPFRLDLTAWALRRRAGNAIDRWDGETYRRVIVIGRRPTELAVRQAGPALTPRLIVTTTPALREPSESHYVRSTIECLLGSNIDLRGWYRVADGDRRLRTLARRFKGMKPPRFPTMFESLVNGFACQQLSLVVGLELLNRLSILCDLRRGPGADAGYAFPTPHSVVALPPSRYQAIGFSRQKVRALLALACAMDRDGLDLAALTDGNDDEVRSRLLELRGVGRWTADYVMLRGLGRLNVFPGDDVGAQKSLARWLGRADAFDYAGVNRVVAKWQPYAGMVYFHLLLDGLSKAGALESAPA
jgi:DNA-3-methyladenine glycosylase II